MNTCPVIVAHWAGLVGKAVSASGIAAKWRVGLDVASKAKLTEEEDGKEESKKG